MKRVTFNVFALLAAVALATAATRARAEQSLHFSSAEGSEVRVDGDSTVHKWTARGGQIDGTVDFRVDAPPDATAEQIVQAVVADPRVVAAASVPATTLKSGKKDMDVKMYGALNSKRYPTLTYELTEVTGVRRLGPTRFVIDTKGKLTVAGTTRELVVPMNVEMTSERAMLVTTEFPTRMTDFNVKPPQAMGGMIKSHNKVVVKVRWSVARRDAAPGGRET